MLKAILEAWTTQEARNKTMQTEMREIKDELQGVKEECQSLKTELRNTTQQMADAIAALTSGHSSPANQPTEQRADALVQLHHTVYSDQYILLHH
jgi:hypothetical protein